MIAFVFPPEASLSASYEADATWLLARYGADAGHSARVTQHALEMLRATLGAFDRPEDAPDLRRALSLASALHDIGRYVAVEGHHRHSRYLIRHSGRTEHWPQALRERVGSLVFTHRRRARANWLRTRFDGDGDGLRLCALLRVADGLDRRHEPGVRIVSLTLEDGGWRLEVEGLRAPEAERLLERKADLFALAFGKPLRLVRRV